jgi:glutamate racemase
MSKNDPIGVFDSGLGGLTVLKQLIKVLPHEDFIYLGDTARVPYGTRSREIVTKFAFEDAEFLLGKKVKCIVVACNTASAIAGKVLKRKLKVPVFDVITPALSEAKRVSKSGKIGVIGTRGTIESGAYHVSYSQSCPLLVPFIEEGDIDSPALKLIARKYLEPFKKVKLDTLIMGCTHYPIIKDIIEKEIDSNKVKLVDPGIPQAKEVFEFLKKNDLLNPQKKLGVKKYYVTDLTDRFVEIAQMFLGQEINGDLKKVTISKG